MLARGMEAAATPHNTISQKILKAAKVAKALDRSFFIKSSTCPLGQALFVSPELSFEQLVEELARLEPHSGSSLLLVASNAHEIKNYFWSIFFKI